MSVSKRIIELECLCCCCPRFTELFTRGVCSDTNKCENRISVSKAGISERKIRVSVDSVLKRCDGLKRPLGSQVHLVTASQIGPICLNVGRIVLLQAVCFVAGQLYSQRACNAFRERVLKRKDVRC